MHEETLVHARITLQLWKIEANSDKAMSNRL